MPPIADFSWPEPDDAVDEKLIANVKTFGCHIMNILADESGPGWSFSIGLYVNFGHPEVVVVGLKDATARTVINDICERIANGERFIAGGRSDQLIRGADVHFLEMALDHFPDYLGYACWFYSSLPEPFPAIQLVWPDRKGRFSWESGHDDSLERLQPLLGPLPQVNA